MLTFEYMGLLLLLPLPWLIYRWFPPAPPSTTVALKIPFWAQLQPIIKPQATQKFGWPQLTAALIWLCLVLAAMGPQWVGEPMTLSRQGRDIVLAVDVSLSMQMQDMRWRGQTVDRLTLVKTVASSFVDARHGDRMGLILFGSRAYIQTPLTFDRQSIEYMLGDASIGLAGRQTALGDAIGLAVKHLKRSQTKDKVLVLLTDGANNAGEVAPLNAAELAAQHGIKIYTIGLGAEAMTIPSFLGSQQVNPSADLDEETLKQIADKTGGLFFRSTDSQSLQRVYQTIDELEPKAYDAGVYTPKIRYFHYPLAMAWVLSVMLVLARRLG